MSQVQLHKAAGYPRMAWKNGAGSTLEIARDAGADLGSFGWRLSIADVGADGAFSSFAGYQRVISVLEGQGMQLTVDGQLGAPLRALQAIAFAGDSQVDCRLLDGAIRDFNLIYAPERYHARLQWYAASQAQCLFSSASILLLFSVADGLPVQLDGVSCGVLERFDCLQIERDAGLAQLQIPAAGAGAYCLVELSPRLC